MVSGGMLLGEQYAMLRKIPGFVYRKTNPIDLRRTSRTQDTTCCLFFDRCFYRRGADDDKADVFEIDTFW